jgi:ubiquitin carboxyl-terminal hydrolase L3
VATKLGLDTARCRFSDVLGTDDELLALVPHPVYALVLLGPDVIEKRIPPDVEVLPTPQNDLVFIKQTIGHACGTMAMLHAVLNSAAPVHSSSLLAALGDRCRGLAADEGARVLENSDELEQAHTSEAKKGQTVAPDPFDSVGFGYCGALSIALLALRRT